MKNRVDIIGRLAFDPELNVTKSGKKVCNIVVACDRIKSEESDFIDCTLWEQVAEYISKYAKKGSLVSVEGAITTDRYTDGEGKTRKSQKVNGYRVIILDRRVQTARNDDELSDDEYARKALGITADGDPDGPFLDINADDLPF